MTSPTIKANNDKSPSITGGGDKRKKSSGNINNDNIDKSTPNEGTCMLPSTTQFPSCGLFSWLKVFRFADLMMRQGC